MSEESLGTKNQMKVSPVEHENVLPGEAPTMKQKVLQMGSSIMAKFDPINQICDHVVGFHFYSGEMNRQLIAHHYCSMLNSEVRQCAVYDSNKPDARLIGVEYIISDRLFKTLPEEEKKFWHSHVYEVKSGLLQCPRVPMMAEKEVMKELISTYGKTIHFWQVDRGDPLPLGEPKIMMAFTQDGQINPELVKKRDELLGVSTTDLRSNRMDLITPTVLPGANQWEKGKWTILDVNYQDVNIKKNL
jgi:hypothetical protein